MPAQPSWFPRLSAILRTLRALQEVPFLDRQAFEQIFQLKDRRARLLMARFRGVRIGNAWAVERLELIQALERIQRGGRVSVGTTTPPTRGRRLPTSQTGTPRPPGRDCGAAREPNADVRFPALRYSAAPRRAAHSVHEFRRTPAAFGGVGASVA